MALERRWIAQCDEPGCAETLVVPPPDLGGPDDKWSAGEYAADSGWNAIPRRRETYCTTHAKEATDA